MLLFCRVYEVHHPKVARSSMDLPYLRCFFVVCGGRYPANITLLRGNHESRQLTQVAIFSEDAISLELCYSLFYMM